MFKFNKAIVLAFFSILFSLNSHGKNEIITSSYDDKQYDSFILDNGLSVLVISDPKAQVAAASLTVAVGSKHSPNHRLGLAHLLEHIVLLGSEKYPDIGSFNQFFKKHNGWSNGSTRPDNTRYHFQLNDSDFDEGLNRLADALHAPLLTDKIIKTATTAVDSEYQGKISNDWRGTLQVIKTQLNPEHPASKFSVGSLATLQPKVGDFKADIQSFYKQYYVAKNMKLVLYSKQSITKLKKQAEKYFNHIQPQGKIVKAVNNPLRLKEQLSTQINVKIRSETSSLDVLFEVPAPRADLNHKTSRYIENLITQRTQGSLFSFLNEKGLITNISISHLGDRDYGLLDVYFALTEKGLVEKDQVISSFFEYLAMLEAVKHDETIYKELSILAERDFDYHTFDEPGDWIDKINSDMFIYPIQHVLNHNAHFKGLNKRAVNQYLDNFKPHKMQIVVSSSKAVTDQIEPLYSMPYSVVAFSDKQLKTWQRPKGNDYFNLPSINPFIGDHQLESYDENEKKPRVILKEQGITLWAKSNNDYQQPKMSGVFNIYTDQNMNSVQSTLIRMLHSQITHNKISDFGYYAHFAGFNFNIKEKISGYQISVTGFNDKYFELLNTIFNNFNATEINKSALYQAKEELKQTIRQNQNDYPYKQIRKAAYQANLVHKYSDKALLEQLDEITLASFQEYVLKINKKVEIEGVLVGNFSNKKMNNFVKQFYKNNKEKLSKNLIKLALKNDLPKNIKHARQLKLNHSDSSIAYVVQSKNTNIKLQAKFKLIRTLLHPEYYKSIRNDKSLGYFVHSHDAKINHKPGLMMVVQSDKYPAKILKSEITQFLQEYTHKLSGMSVQSFEKVKQSLIKRLLKPENNLSQHANKLSEQIHLGFDEFDEKQQIITALKSIDKTSLLDFYQKYFNADINEPLIIYSLGKFEGQSAQSCLTAKCL